MTYSIYYYSITHDEIVELMESSRITIPKCYDAKVRETIILFEVITSFKVVSKYFETLTHQRLQRIKKLSGNNS